MPQLDLFGESKRTMITWTYSIDITRPHEAALFYVMVTGARQLAVEHGLCSIPHNVVHEEVSGLLLHTWDSYLFGEPGDVRKACNHEHKAWLQEAKERIRNIR